MSWTSYLARSYCSLCGNPNGLRVFKDVGAPYLRMTADGPSHSRFRIVCADATSCLERRAGARAVTKRAPVKRSPGRPPGPVKRGRPPNDDGLTKYERQKRMILRRVTKHAPRTKAAVAKKKAARKKVGRVKRAPRPELGVPASKLARDLAEPDDRPACPTHGPRSTTVVDDVLRFVCCGLPVPGAAAPPKVHRWA